MRIRILLLLLLCVPFALAEQCLSTYTLERERIEAAQLFLVYRGNIRLVGMDAIIVALKPLRDTAELEALREEFAFVTEQSADALTLRDLDLLDERAVDLDTIVLKFRNALGPADLKQLRKIVHDALRDEADRIAAFRNQALFARKQYFLKEFDRSICVYRTVLEGLDADTHSTKRLLDQLRRTQDLRPKLEAATDDVHRECKDTPVFQCGRDSVEDLEALQRMFQEGLRNIKSEVLEQTVTDRLRGAMAVLRADIEILSEDIAAEWPTPPEALAEQRADLVADLEKAEEKFAEGKYDLVDDLMEDVERDYRSLEQRYRALRGNQ